MNFKIFYAGQELNVVCNEAIDNIIKIASYNDHVFLVTVNQQLFFGTLNGTDARTQIQIELIRNDIIDVACSVDSIYVVDVNGCVQHCPLMAFDFDKRWNDIPILNYSAIYEGTATDQTCVRVVELNCNNDGALFVTAARELYAMGNFNDVCASDQPIKVPQFIDYEILQVAMGMQFAIVLTRKRLHRKSINCDETISSKSTEDSSDLSSSNSELVTPANHSSDSLNNVLTELKPATIHDVECEMEKLTDYGCDQISTQVWCFGSVNRGQLGIGDHVKRKQAVEITSLRGQGVCQIYTGDEHTAALTLDGRLYLWGDNSNEQISHWLDKEDCSSPRRFHKNEQNILGVQCGQCSTFILTNNLERYELSRNKHFASIHISKTDESHQHLFLANKQYLVIGNMFGTLKFEQFLKIEQQFLQDILQKTRPSVEHFIRTIDRNNIFKYPNLYRQFFQQYNCITELSATNIHSILRYSRGLSDFDAIAFIRNYREFIHTYRLYTKFYCDIICSDDFARTHQIIIPNTDFTSKFSVPLQHTINYIEFLTELFALNHTNALLQKALDQWHDYRREMDLMLKAANTTITFWITNQKLIPNTLQLPERRVIIDSKDQPLKLLPSSRFKTNWFILFNDLFCHSTGSSSSIKQYPLKTVWITNIIDKDVSPSTSTTNLVRKYAMKIVTPEEQFTISATSNDVKMKWLDAIEQQIKENCGKTNAKMNFLVRRTTTYTFSDKHRVYPMCKYLGQWNYGKMHGLGCIEFPDRRIYTGQFDSNVISGYGRLTIPNVSCYEGRFVDGKYNGFGTLETHPLNENYNYEGFFKAGNKHGFGILTDNNRTYIGGFAGGLQHGYGVLDNSDNGEKYMGLFADGIRNGHGFCITDDGKYFGGHFVDNELNGNGVAVFTNGSYYEGDLTIYGPIGRGSLYLPVETVGNEFSCEMENRKVFMRGNVLSGSLHGNWDNVKINNGNISIDQEFIKYPNQLDEPIIDSSLKWISLFSDWEVEVFGTSIAEVDDIRKVWRKITESVQNAKQMESLKSTISTSAILYESGANMNRHHQQHQSDNLLNAIQSNNQYDYHFSKSASLSHITGKKYKRNLLAVERHKSVSNEFLNTAANFMQENLQADECNNNNDGKMMAVHRTDSRASLSNTDANLFSTSATFQNQMPYFGITKFDTNDFRLVRDYLTKAFKNQNHPLGVLNTKISYCFYTSYGCWKVKPISIISSYAMQEWESISKRIYDIVRVMFPKLPQEYCSLDEEFISYRSLLYPILLSEGVYSTLFVLYANKCSKRDEIYRQRIIFSEKKSDIELMEHLKITMDHIPLIKHEEFELAIIALGKVKEKFCPREMLKMIEQTFKHVENAAKMLSESNKLENEQTTTTNIERNPPIFQLNADNMMPLTIYLLLRAAIPHLGTEILLLEELMGPDFEFVMQGFAGYCFTTIKAAYQHIINELFL